MLRPRPRQRPLLQVLRLLHLLIKLLVCLRADTRWRVASDGMALSLCPALPGQV